MYVVTKYAHNHAVSYVCIFAGIKVRKTIYNQITLFHWYITIQTEVNTVSSIFHLPYEAIQMRNGKRTARKTEYTVTVPTQMIRHAPSMAAALATRRLSSSFLAVLQN